MDSSNYPDCFATMSPFEEDSRAKLGCARCPYEISCKKNYTIEKAERYLKNEENKNYLDRFEIF
jgi:hypothetical protein